MVSVIIPVYNKEAYLNDLLSDLSAQTFSDYECILVDDGSTDRSGILCDEACKTDERIKVFHINNCGVSNARNFGIDKSEGEYITFVDSDDRLYPEYLENLYNLITENDVDFVISGLENFWIGLDKISYTKAPYAGKKYKSEILQTFGEVQKETGIFGFCVAKIFRRELTENIRFDPNVRLAEDLDFYLKIYRKIDCIYFDDKCYYRYLQMADNSSQIIVDDKIDYFMQLVIRFRIRDFLMSENAYEKENKKIIDEMINNYVFFVLFHSPTGQIKEKFKDMKKIVDSNLIDLNSKSFFKKVILFLFKNDKPTITKLILSARRALKTVIRKIKN